MPNKGKRLKPDSVRKQQLQLRLLPEIVKFLQCLKSAGVPYSPWVEGMVAESEAFQKWKEMGHQKFKRELSRNIKSIESSE